MQIALMPILLDIQAVENFAVYREAHRSGQPKTRTNFAYLVSRYFV